MVAVTMALHILSDKRLGDSSTHWLEGNKVGTVCGAVAVCQVHLATPGSLFQIWQVVCSAGCRPVCRRHGKVGEAALQPTSRSLQICGAHKQPILSMNRGGSSLHFSTSAPPALLRCPQRCFTAPVDFQGN